MPPPVIPTESASCLCPSTDAAVIARGKDFEYDTCSNEFTMQKCRNCGLVYLNPRPALETLGVIYPSDYIPYRFDALPAPVKLARDWVQKGKVSLMRKLIGTGAARVMDVGCGNGGLLQLIQKYGPKTWELYGNDFNREALELLNKKGIGSFHGRVEEINTDLRFDLIILNQVIEHLGDIPSVLKGIRRLLKPGGTLLIETPSTDGEDAYLFKKRYWGGYHFPRHWYLFTGERLREVLEKEDFKVTRKDYLLSPSFWLQSCHHFFKDKGLEVVACFFRPQNPLALFFFTMIDFFALCLGKRTSNMRLVAKRAG